MKRVFIIGFLTLASMFGESSGTLVGLITASNGEAVRNAHVVLVNEVGVRRETRTNQEGIYAFSLLPAGEYRLEAVKPGSAPLRVDHIVMGADEKRSLRLQWNAATNLQSRNAASQRGKAAGD